MHLRTSTSKQYGALALILIYLTATLLPAHAWAAADQVVVVPEAVVDTMAYQALWQQAYQGNDAVEALIYDMFILEAGKAGLSETEMEAMMGDYMTAVDAQLHNPAVLAAQGPTSNVQPSVQEVAQHMFEAAITVQKLRPFVKGVWRSFARPLRSLPGLDQSTIVGSISGGFLEGAISEAARNVVKTR